MVFDKLWFRKHRKVLLFLLNNSVLKYWFRYVMRIRKCDLPLKTKIIDFGPNWFTHSAKLKCDQVELQTSFRSNEKYARRMYFAFEPVWWMMHFWDWLVADRFIPSLSFNFSTLPTVYSTPGSTVSGNTSRLSVSENFATIRAAAATAVSYDAGTNGPSAYLAASTSSGVYWGIVRGYFLLDCSALSSDSTITEATVSLYTTSRGTGLGSNFEVDIVSSAPSSNTTLATGDHTSLGTTPFSSVAYASFADNTYEPFSLNASGIAAISKTGISKFGTRINWDTDNSFGGTYGSAYGTSKVVFADGGASSTTQDPKIDITYTLPATGFANLLLLGVG